MYNPEEDDENNEETDTPILKRCVVEYEFPEKGVTIREEMTITQTGGIFGEKIAEIKVTEGDQSEPNVFCKMPVPQWVGRLLAVVSKTCNASSPENMNSKSLEEIKPIHKYIFKR